MSKIFFPAHLDFVRGLGVTTPWQRSVNHKGTGWKTVFQTEGKRFTRAKVKVKEKLFKMMHVEVGIQAKAINSIWVGHFNYSGIAGNADRIENFWHFVRCYWRRCLSRRSQNAKVSWNQISELLEKHPLISPRIKIPDQDLGSYVRL